MIQSICYATAQAEWKGHARQSDAQSNLPIGQEQAQVHLQSNQEQEEYQTDIGSHGEGRHGGSGKDMFCEAGYTSKYRGTKEDATNDFGNDSRLADLGEGEMEDSTEDDDDSRLEDGYRHQYDEHIRRRRVTYLNYEDDDGVLWIILRRIGPFEDATLLSYLGHCHVEARVRVSQTEKRSKDSSSTQGGQGKRLKSRPGAVQAGDLG